MILTNAERQKRWRDKRNALAREALAERRRGWSMNDKAADAKALRAKLAEVARECAGECRSKRNPCP